MSSSMAPTTWGWRVSETKLLMRSSPSCRRVLETRSSRSTCPAQPSSPRSSVQVRGCERLLAAREPLAAHQLAVADGPELPGVPGRLDSAQLPAPASGGRDHDLVAGVQQLAHVRTWLVALLVQPGDELLHAIGRHEDAR